MTINPEGRLVQSLDPEQRRTLEGVCAAAARIWARPLFRYFTDHGPGHSARIVDRLDGLTEGVQATAKRLCPDEVFALLAAACLHDIGMQNERYAGGDLEHIRAHHHERTAEMMYALFADPVHAFPIPLAGEPGLAEAVARVARGHRRVDLAGPDYEPLIHAGATLRLRLLAALLRFADALDIDHRRVDLDAMKRLYLPLASQLHWWRCHTVSGVTVVDETVRIAYRFPQSHPDYEALIVPLVERDVRAELAALEDIFRAEGIKVAIARSQVILMRTLPPLPPEVEALMRQQGDAVDGPPPPAAGQPPVAPDPEAGHPAGARYEIHINQAQGLAIGDGATVVGARQSAAPYGLLRLALGDALPNEPGDHLTAYIPHADPARPGQATSVPARIWLLNDSDRMARYLVVEVNVAAPFLAYPYASSPLAISGAAADRWRIEQTSPSGFRCSFEGGADCVCHKRDRRDIGLLNLLAPWGEADGGPVTVSITYRIAAEDHAGGDGVLSVRLEPRRE